MKKLTFIACLIAVVMLFNLCNNNQDNVGNDEPIKEDSIVVIPELPREFANSCPISDTAFASWFADGKITENGFVNAANSLAPLHQNCDFYNWSWQMFLWQTSKTAGNYVFNSSSFFDLINGNLIQSNINNKMMVRGGKFVSEGQAGPVSGVLMSQLRPGITPEGSLVFYGIHVNDVYGYFASGKNSNQLQDVSQFPTSKAQLDAITGYAKQVYNVDIKDGQSLTMEMKSSWVKVEAGKNYDGYITMQSDVPLFIKKDDKLWTWDGVSFENNVTLAMVGYHLVGSTAGHPEMIWATFEHKSNSTDIDYYYIDSSNQVKQKKMFDSAGFPIFKDMLFTNGSVKLNASNQMFMELSKNKIIAEQGQNISPSSTIRTHPFGSDATAANAENNTQLISLNSNIQGLLKGNDARKNYFLVGAIWTKNGVPGVGNQLPELKGSKMLANSTMETYQQYKSCFSCHNGGNLTGLSHIFGTIKPIPIPVR